MTEEDVVSVPIPQANLKRKLNDVEPEQHDGSDNNSNGAIVDDSNTASDSSQAKRTKIEDDNGKVQENGGSSMEVKEEEHKEEETENEDNVPVAEQVQDPIHAAVEDQTAVHPEDKQQSCVEETNAEECKDVNGDGSSKEEIGNVEECKDVNGDGSSKEEIGNVEERKDVNGDGSSKEEIGNENKEVEVDDTQSTTRMINVPSSKVGVLIGKGGETVRYLQFNSGAKIQILKDSEADPNSEFRPVEIIGNVSCIENAEKLINAVIAEAEAGAALVVRGHPATHVMGTPKQIEIKVPNDKVGVIIGRGGETIKNMQTRSGARIQLIPHHPEGDDGSKERTVRISGDKRQIDIATDMIKDVMYQNARSSPYSGGYNQPAYRPRGPGGPPRWGPRGPHAPHPMPYDYHHRGSYSSQGSQYSSPGYGGYPPQHMPPRSGYGPGWDQRPPHSGSYSYYGRQGAQTSGPVPPPPSQVSYGYGQSHGPDYGHAAPYSQTGHQHTYGQMYEQPKYDNNPPVQQPPYGGSYPATGGGQTGYSQMQQPGGRPYGVQQGPVQQGYGPPRPVAAASSGNVPYQSATPAVAAPVPYGSTTMAPQQQQYVYTSTGGSVQQQTYPSYISAPTSDGYNNGTQTPATGPTYQQQSVLPASSAHDQPGAQQASAAGYGGPVAPTGGYSSYPSAQPAYGTGQTQNYGYNTSSQDPYYGYGAAPGSQPAYSQAAPGCQPTYSQAAPGSQPTYSQAVPTQAGYEQQSATQSAGYAAAPGS